MKTRIAFPITLAALVLWLTTTATPLRAATTCLTPGAPDPTFDPTRGDTLPGIEGALPTPWLWTLAPEQDGRVYVGGDFSAVNGEPRAGLARLLPDGTLDRSFQLPWTNSVEVFALARQPDGKLLVLWRSWIHNFPAQPGGGVVRLNSDGSLDTSFTNFWSGPWVPYVRCLALQPDGKFLVGGEFMEPRTGIARFNSDGTLDETFTPPLLPAYDGTTVKAIVLQPERKILLGGSYGIGLLRLKPDGSEDFSFHSGVEIGGSVNAIQPQPDGRILIGGSIDCTGDDELHNVMRLRADGSVDDSFSAVLDIVPLALALQPDGRILAGGECFRQEHDSEICRFNPDGSRDVAFQAQVDIWYGWPAVTTMLLQPDGKLLIGGAFTNVNGLPAVAIARLCGGPMASQVIAWGSNYGGQTNVPPDLTNALSLAAGMWHGLALTAEGRVVGWMNANNEYSEAPPVLTNALAISSQGFYDLAMLRDGTVRAWGRWWNGLQYEPVSVPPDLTNVVAIAAGWHHNLALMGDGTVVGWDAKYYWYGQTEAPWDLTEVVEIAVGLFHSLALRADGTVVAWGLNAAGLCAVPTGLTNVVAIACGQEHSLALKADGSIVGWGRFWDGHSYSPVTIPASLTNVVSISSSGLLNLALKSDGTVAAWGVGSFVATNLPTGLANAVGIFAGGDYGLALVGDGRPQITRVPMGRRVFTGTPVHLTVQAGGARPLTFQWQKNGTNIVGATNATLSLPNPQLADAGEYSVVISNSLATVTSTPARLVVSESPPVILRRSDEGTVVRAMSWHCEVQAQGSQPMSYQWLRDGSAIPGATERRLTLTNVQWADAGLYRVLVSNAFGTAQSAEITLAVFAGTAWGNNGSDQCDLPLVLPDAVEFAGGMYHSVALKADGTLVTWGTYNEDGQQDVPVGLTNVAALAVGPYHTLALTRDGKVVAWGDTSAGRADIPTGLTDVIAVAAGTLHSLALLDDGTVAAWGSNLDQHDEYVGQATVPSGLSNVIAIAAGDYHSLALLADGRVIAWGANAAGQTNVPTTLTNAIVIAAAGARSLAVRTDATVVGWGDDPYVPAELTNVIALALGAAHNLALKSDGTVVAWGESEMGQLNVPEGLTNVVAIAAGQYHSLALIGPISPIRLQLSDPRLVANAFTVRTPTRDRHSYVLEYKGSFTDTNWTALPGIQGYGYGVVRRLSDPAPAVSQRFYRVTENP